MKPHNLTQPISITLTRYELQIIANALDIEFTRCVKYKYISNANRILNVKKKVSKYLTGRKKWKK